MDEKRYRFQIDDWVVRHFGGEMSHCHCYAFCVLVSFMLLATASTAWTQPDPTGAERAEELLCEPMSILQRALFRQWQADHGLTGWLLCDIEERFVYRAGHQRLRQQLAGSARLPLPGHRPHQNDTTPDCQTHRPAQLTPLPITAIHVHQAAVHV